MRRFDTPAAPPGWVGKGAELLRIVDPTGRAIAWLAPGFGANCVGYAVRQDSPAPGSWRHLLRAGGPRDLQTRPLDYGCAVLGPESGDGGSAHLAVWRFVERDPTAAMCSVQCDGIRLDLTARLEDAVLHLDLLATNEGAEVVPIASGLRLCLAGGFHGDISRLAEGRAATFVSEELAMRLVVDVVAGQEEAWHVDRLPEGGTAVVVRSATEPGARIASSEQV